MQSRVSGALHVVAGAALVAQVTNVGKTFTNDVMQGRSPYEYDCFQPS